MPNSPNNRIFYACQAVAFEPLYANGTSYSTRGVVPLHGVQSVGINTSFNLEQAFELGQIAIYENIENVPEVEVTLEKVLDGYPLMYHVATSGVADSVALAANRSPLVARSKERTNVVLGIFSESYDSVGSAGQAGVEVLMTGMYVSSISYTLPTDGNCKESLTLVGNHKAWNSSISKFTSTLAGTLLNDEPTNLTGTPAYGGIQRRENVDIKNSILPLSMYGVAATATFGNGYDTSTSVNRVHIQNCTMSASLNRESIQELGKKAPYYRYANYPVEITTDFEVISVSGDFINAYESGDTSKYAVGTRNYGNNTAEELIVLKLHDGTIFNMGGKNRLKSVDYTGADAGGGNATLKYSYSTFNTFYVTSTVRDPAGATDASGVPASYNGA
jgi:hypothetical protein